MGKSVFKGLCLGLPLFLTACSASINSVGAGAAATGGGAAEEILFPEMVGKIVVNDSCMDLYQDGSNHFRLFTKTVGNEVRFIWANYGTQECGNHNYRKISNPGQLNDLVSDFTTVAGRFGKFDSVVSGVPEGFYILKFTGGASPDDVQGLIVHIADDKVHQLLDLDPSLFAENQTWDELKTASAAVASFADDPVNSNVGDVGHYTILDEMPSTTADMDMGISASQCSTNEDETFSQRFLVKLEDGVVYYAVAGFPGNGTCSGAVTYFSVATEQPTESLEWTASPFKLIPQFVSGVPSNYFVAQNSVDSTFGVTYVDDDERHIATGVQNVQLSDPWSTWIDPDTNPEFSAWVADPASGAINSIGGAPVMHLTPYSP